MGAGHKQVAKMMDVAQAISLTVTELEARIEAYEEARKDIIHEMQRAGRSHSDYRAALLWATSIISERQSDVIKQLKGEV